MKVSALNFALGMHSTAIQQVKITKNNCIIIIIYYNPAAFSRFKGVSDKLKNAIKPSAMAVAEKLLAKGLLAQATYDEMIDGRDNAIKAAKIVNELQAALKIRDNPDKYLNEICDALREVEEPLITDMANKLSK